MFWVVLALTNYFSLTWPGVVIAEAISQEGRKVSHSSTAIQTKVLYQASLNYLVQLASSILPSIPMHLQAAYFKS